jgi:putative inorganic carbon (HCO3(-)) transporter
MALLARLGGRVASPAVLTAGAVVAVGLVLGVASVASATLTIAGAMGVLFLVVAARNLALGFCVFVVITFFDRTTALQTGGLTMVKAAGAALTLLWLFELASNRGDRPTLFRSHRHFSLLVVFLVSWAVASALWAPDPRLALTSGTGSALRLTQGILLLFIVFTAFRERRHVWWFVWAFLGGTAFAVVIGLAGVYGVSATENDSRLSGGFDDPNELAAVLVPALVLCAFAFVAAGRRPIRWLYAGLAALFFYSFAQTDSQAGIVALVVALLLAVVVSGRVRPRAAVAVACFFLFATVYYTFVTEPVALQTIGSQNNVGARESLWTVAGRIVRDHPVAGVGAGNFGVAEQSYTAKSINLPRADLVTESELAHNSYLQVLAELGVVGLLAFLGVIGGSLWFALRAARTFEAGMDWELEMLSRGLFIGTIGMLTAYFFATNQYEKQLWLLVAIGAALLSIARRTAPATARETLRRDAARQAAIRPRSLEVAPHRGS